VKDAETEESRHSLVRCVYINRCHDGKRVVAPKPVIAGHSESNWCCRIQWCSESEKEIRPRCSHSLLEPPSMQFERAEVVGL
jgi:hypothetical protein